MKLLILILATSSAVAAQSARDLRNKYGQPKAETFRVRSDVDMTVTYGKTGTACTIILEPVFYWLGAWKLDEDTTVMKMSTVRAIFDELVPKERRGRLLSGPREAHVEWVYENVDLVAQEQTETTRRAIIIMKTEGCK